MTSGRRSMMFHMLSGGIAVRGKSRFIPARKELTTCDVSGTEVDPRPCERAPVGAAADVHRPHPHPGLALLGHSGFDDSCLVLGLEHLAVLRGLVVRVLP